MCDWLKSPIFWHPPCTAASKASRTTITSWESFHPYAYGYLCQNDAIIAVSNTSCPNLDRFSFSNSIAENTHFCIRSLVVSGRVSPHFCSWYSFVFYYFGSVFTYLVRVTVNNAFKIRSAGQMVGADGVVLHDSIFTFDFFILFVKKYFILTFALLPSTVNTSVEGRYLMIGQTTDWCDSTSYLIGWKREWK